MRLHCEFSIPVARTDLDDYIRHLEISVGCYDEDALNEYIVGKLAGDDGRVQAPRPLARQDAAHSAVRVLLG